MRTALTTLSVLLLTAGAALLGPVAPVAAAAPVVDVSPGGLPRGSAPTVAYVEGPVIVDGSRRIATGASEVRLLGRSGSALVAGTAYADGRSQRVVRFAADGSRRVIARGVDIGSIALSDDGSRLVRLDDEPGTASRVSILDTRTGKELASTSVRGYPTVLDVARGRVLLASYGPDRTRIWRPARDTWRTVMRRAADLGDLEHDRLAWIQGDPYAGGCTRLAHLSDPTDVVWRSCRDAVVGISPDGSRLLTLHKLTDGLGPGELRVRDTDGTLRATYQVAKGWFPHSQWESGTALLIEVNGPRRAAWVRCTDGDCERASRFRPAEQP